jgi:hypothetical protein
VGDKYRWESFEGPGGKEFDQQEYKRGALHADLTQLAVQVSLQHGSRIVDAILDKYEVTAK